MPTYTYDKDIRDLPVQPRPRDFDPDAETRMTGEELDARDRGSADVIRDWNEMPDGGGRSRPVDGRVVGTADAGDLYENYAD